jgi:hypothetical protein
MPAKKTRCLLHAGSTPKDKASFASRPIDSKTTQAFHQLQFHAEELALELAVRLRVLGKSLGATCPGPAAVEGKRAGGLIAYKNVRRQLDVFLGGLTESEIAGHQCFPVIRHCIQDSLPYELNDCVVASSCRIELVETLISLLSDSICENHELAGGPLHAYSF